MNFGRRGFFILALVAVLKMSGPAAAADLVETRPVVPSDKFTGRTAETYKLAAEFPGVMDGLYCYCKCKENQTLKHKTLLTCFTGDHASKCEICMREAEIAGEMTKQGKSTEEIHAAIDQYGKAKLREAEEKEAREKAAGVKNAPESDSEHHHHQ